MEEHENHGNSVAAWTGVGIVLVGFTIMALAVLFPSVVLFVVGVVVAIGGVVVGKVMAMAGYGVAGKQTQPERSEA